MDVASWLSEVSLTDVFPEARDRVSAGDTAAAKAEADSEAPAEERDVVLSR